MTGVIIAVLILAVILVKNPKLLGIVKARGDKTGINDPRILITIGIILFNLISWSMIPWLWDILTYNSLSLAVFNIGFWLVLYLRTIKIKDDKGKETKELDKAAARVSTLIAMALTVALLTIVVIKLQTWWKNKSNHTGGDQNMTAGFSPGIGSQQAPSMETILQIIADCETGGGVPGAGHQFNDDGTPVRNPPNAKPGTGAVGKWQINLNDSAVAKVVKDHNWDVEGSEADNKAAATFLHTRPIEEGGGTAPWTASAGCWAPKITMPGGLIATLEAPPGEWSNSFPVRRNFNFVNDWVDDPKGSRHQVEYTLRDGRVIVKNFPAKEVIPGEVASFRVKSLEAWKVIVKIVLTPI